MSSYACSSDGLGEYSMVSNTLTLCGLVRSLGSYAIGLLCYSHMAFGYPEHRSKMSVRYKNKTVLSLKSQLSL